MGCIDAILRTIKNEEAFALSSFLLTQVPLFLSFFFFFSTNFIIFFFFLFLYFIVKRICWSPFY